MRIELDSLEKAGEFAQTYQPDELKLGEHDVSLIEPVEIRGRLWKGNWEVNLAGRLTAKLEAPCARCLKPVALPIAADFSERFVPEVSWGSEEQHELHEEDLDLAIFDGEALEIDDVVREELLLALPAQVLCREDCKGLCPACGADRNVTECECETRQVDLRWQALKDLQF
jgi:uncharacterized protein